MVMYGRSLLRTIYLAKLWLEERQDAEYAAVGVEDRTAPPDDHAVLSKAGRALLDHLESLTDRQIWALEVFVAAGKLPGSTADMTRRILPDRITFRKAAYRVPRTDRGPAIARLMNDRDLAEHLDAARDRISSDTWPNYL